jgi:hypothetical protein
VRAERIELSSLAWKAGILAIIRRPRAFKLYQILAYNRKRKGNLSYNQRQYTVFLNKFNNNFEDTPLHSSGYAEIARPKKIGSMAPQSFNQRLHIEKNRQAVGKYHHSMIANGHHRHANYQRTMDVVAPRADAVQPSTPPAGVNRRSSYRAPNRLIADIKPVARQNFSEPTGRSYNPYQ